MPIYEYECPNCGTFELMHGFYDERPTTCKSARKLALSPELLTKGCKSKVKKLVSSGVGVIYNTAGFHTTDYGSGN